MGSPGEAVLTENAMDKGHGLEKSTKSPGVLGQIKVKASWWSPWRHDRYFHQGEHETVFVELRTKQGKT